MDSRGWLWATKDCGTASVYDGTEWKHLNASNTNLPSHLGFGDITEDGNHDLWIGAAPAVRLRTKTLVGATEPSAKASSMLRVWPNPAERTLHIELPPGTSGLLELSDAQGRIVLQKNIIEGTGPQVQVDRGSLPAGLYFIRFMEKKGRQLSQKIIFE